MGEKREENLEVKEALEIRGRCGGKGKRRRKSESKRR